MKRITLFLFLILFSFSGFAQLTENFEGSTSPDLVSDTWQLGSGTWGVFDNGVGTAQSCTFNDTPPAPPAPPLVYEG
ncbi:MAG TPA: hypothetical protein PLA69_08595, partial [Flavobacterium sp.]|nr:hypothetical protein [Flavobacterium sp.]